jgi:hypothetical protein
MEALFREIVTSPCTAQPPTAESCKVSFTSSQSAAVMDNGADETGPGLDFLEMSERFDRTTKAQAREKENHSSFADGETEIYGYSVTEWQKEMEMESLLDEMIAMTGLVEDEETLADSPYASVDFPDIGVSLGLGMDLGVNLDMTTLGGWDMDAAVGGIEVR